MSLDIADIIGIEFIVNKQNLIVLLQHPDDDQSKFTFPRDMEIIANKVGFYVAGTHTSLDIIAREYSCKYESKKFATFDREEIRLPLEKKSYFKRMDWFLWQWGTALHGESDQLIKDKSSLVGWWSPCKLSENGGARRDCSNPYRIVDLETFNLEISS